MSSSKISYFPLASDEEKRLSTPTSPKNLLFPWKNIALAVLLLLNIGLIVAMFYNGIFGPSPVRSNSLSLCSMKMV